MNTFRLAGETLTDQGKDGQTNTHEDGRRLWFMPGFFFFFFFFFLLLLLLLFTVVIM